MGGAALLTGCAGFLGAHLTDRLLAAGWRVAGIDNLATGRMANLTDALANDRFSFERRDVTDPFTGPADLVINLAAIAAPLRYAAAPVETFKTAVLGAMHAGAAALAAGAPLLHASTSEIYGAPAGDVHREDDWGRVNPIGPRACYAEGKRAAETLLFDLRRAEGLDLRLTRIFNVYGPRMDPFDGRVVPTFARQALEGAPLTVHGDGRQTRSFCYVDDAVEALFRTAVAAPGLPAPMNIGNPAEMSVLELAETIRDLAGARSEIVFTPLPAEDPARRRPDIGRAGAALGWAPAVGIRDGLERTLADIDRTLADSAAGRP